MDGKANAFERARTLDWLRRGDAGGVCRIVTNARCLTEGVDVPALDAVVFLEPRRSEIDVVQAVGRVMRRAPGKEVGYVVLPVVVPTGSRLTDDKVLEGSDFKQVWSVLKALRSHDERVDVWVNTADLGGSAPVEILTEACHACGGFNCDAADDCTARSSGELDVKTMVQGRLPLENAIASKLVEKCGDRQYWDRWAASVEEIASRITTRINGLLSSDPGLQEAFDRFLAAMQSTVGEHVTQTELTSMLAQHVVTLPVFDALFTGSGFADRNPVSKALNELLGEFKARDHRLADETRDLERFYDSVRKRLAGAAGSDARLTVLLEIYEKFFKNAMPDQVSRLGIVYTPVGLVDFILRSADAVLCREFGRGLTDRGVHILDPFTGTGTFVNRLLTQRGSDGEFLIRSEDLHRKFTGDGAVGGMPEIHANEIVLLAYYLAAVKIEEGYHARTPDGFYQPFNGIVLKDTFRSKDSSRLPGTDPIASNSRRADRQDDLPIQVIIANPPWSAGQKSAGDDNPNIEYPHIAERVRETYGKHHKQVTGRGAGKSAGNLYVQALRWASDRLREPAEAVDQSACESRSEAGALGQRPGVIAFVHPNSLTNGTSLTGMRAALRDEFTGIYVVNLRGDAYKSGEEFRREGAKIFGQGSRNGVQVTLLVRNPDRPADAPAVLRYAEVSERSTLKEKFAWLESLGDVTSGQLDTVPVNDRHDWVNITDGTFDQMLKLCSTDKRDTEVAVKDHALGLTTNCDVYVYSFSRDDLIARVRRFIEAYNEARIDYEIGLSDLEQATIHDQLDVVKWTSALKQSLKQKKPIVFDEGRIREVLYRPFTKLWLYEDDRILSSVKTISKMFPRDTGGGGGREREGAHSIRLGAAQSSRGDHPQQPVQPDPLLNARRSSSARPAHSRSSRPSCTPVAAICISGTSNMTFQALATMTIPDLAMVKGSRQTRTIPRLSAPKRSQ